MKSLSFYIHNLYQNQQWLDFILYLGLGLILTLSLMSVVALVLVYAERKIAAHFQCRLGPMRVGWHGTLQTVADALKLLLKEDLIPKAADRFLFALAPFLTVMAALLSLSVLPFSLSATLSNMNIGLLFLSAISGYGVLGILIGGWASNNKWSLLGAMRAGAQLISYELSMTLSLLSIVVLSGSLNLNEIIASQAQGWWIWRAHLVGFISFVIYIISSTAETNRTPFDMAEGESELTAGFHTEYSGMRFAFFFLSEYVNLFIVSAIGSILFLGGWMPLHIGEWESFNALMDFVPGPIWFLLKTGALIFLSMWFRWTFPRLRVDQLMRFEWKFLLPLGLINLFLSSIIALGGFYFFP